MENLFPWAQVEFAIRDRYDDFAGHEMAFQVRVRVVLASPVTAIW